MRDVIAGIAAVVVPRQYAVLSSAGTETTFGFFRLTDTVSSRSFLSETVGKLQDWIYSLDSSVEMGL